MSLAQPWKDAVRLVESGQRCSNVDIQHNIETVEVENFTGSVNNDTDTNVARTNTFTYQNDSSYLN